jgi:ABC-type thiamine transport system substrate-binding protein
VSKTCLRQNEFAGILNGTKQRDLAEKWLDFILSMPYQEDLLLNQFACPVNPQAKVAFALRPRPVQSPLQYGNDWHAA